MRSKIRYQLLDPSAAPKTFKFIWILLFLAVCFVAYYLWIFNPKKGIYGKLSKTLYSLNFFSFPDPLTTDKQNPMTYEQVVNDLRNEIDQRNAIISELQKDFVKMELKTEFVSFF